MIESPTSSRAATVRRMTGVCGIISQLVGITALVVVISRAPEFNWTEDHISFFGVEGSTKTIYNSGLIVVGILSLIFAIGLGRCLLSGWLGQSAMVFFILGSAAVFTMGACPRTWDFAHGASTVAFYVCIIAALVLTGAAAITASQVIWGLLSITTAVFVAALLLIPGPLAGGAITQLLAYLPWALWTIALGVVLLVNPSSLRYSK